MALAAACQPKAPSITQAEWIDLTHAFDSTTLYWPNNVKGFEHPVDFEGQSPAGFYYSSFALSTPEHGGTHLDAPKHFAENRLAADEIPLSSLTGPAVVIDISEKAMADRDYLLSVQDITDWENKNGRIDDNTIILVKTGYSKFYPDRLKYFGTDKKGLEAIPELHFPGIDSATVTWLLQNRKIKAMGLDTPSLDRGQSKLFEAHQVLLAQNKPRFENLTNLDLLPAKGIYVVALPMKIAKGSGGPLRIIATVLK
jgi:kynurenine formamidase